MKTQTIRLVDVFVLGPFMIWAGYEIGKRKDFAGMALALAGVATIGYNWKNYKEAESGLAGIGEQYTPHIHTDECPGGYPIPQGLCLK